MPQAISSSTSPHESQVPLSPAARPQIRVSASQVGQGGRGLGIRPSVLLALITIYIVWGSTYLAIRLALVSFPPFMLICARFVAAGAILFLIALARREKLPSATQWRNSAIVGGLLLGGGVGMTAYTEQYIPSSLAVIIIASSPIWIAIASGLLLRQWPQRLEWIGIAVGFAGVALLGLDGHLQAQPLALVSQLVAINCWAVGSALGRTLALPKGIMGNAAEMLCGSVILAVMTLVRHESLPTTFEPQAIAAWVYLVTFGSILAYTAYMHVLRNLRPAMASSYAYVNPIVAIALGYLFGERIAPVAFLAIGVVLTGVVIVSIVQAKQTAAH